MPSCVGTSLLLAALCISAVSVHGFFDEAPVIDEMETCVSAAEEHCGDMDRLSDLSMDDDAYFKLCEDQACSQAMEDMKLCIDKLAEGQSQTIKSMALLLQAPTRSKGFCDCPRTNQMIDVACGLQVLADSETLSAVDGVMSSFTEQLKNATNELPRELDELDTIRSDVDSVVDDLNSNDFENAMEDFNTIFEDLESPDTGDFNLTGALNDLAGLFGGAEENADLDEGLEDLGMAFLGLFSAIETCVQPVQNACPEEMVKEMGLGEDMFSLDNSMDYSNTDYLNEGGDQQPFFGSNIPTEEEFKMLCSNTECLEALEGVVQCFADSMPEGMMDPNDPDMAIQGSITSMCECEYGPNLEECMKQKAAEAAKVQPGEVKRDPFESDPSAAFKPGMFSVYMATATILIASAMVL